MPGSVKRAVAIVAGVVLGMAIAAGTSPWRELLRKTEPVRPAPDPARARPRHARLTFFETNVSRNPGVPT